MPAYDPVAAGALCDRCPLRGSVVVPPSGRGDADVVIVGEAPGFNEVKQGKPFVGASGVKLADLLLETQFKTRDSLFITNTLLCRPEVPGVEGKERYNVKRYIAWLRKENMRRKKVSEPLLESPFTCCAPRLYRELERAEWYARVRNCPNGAVVIPLGNFALGAIVQGQPGKAQGIMKYRGSVIPLDTPPWRRGETP